ncbi:MAG: hypothetical protein ACFB03_06715 [Paracoccaceae bacterium]
MIFSGKPLVLLCFLISGGLAKAESVREIKLHSAESAPIVAGTLQMDPDGSYKVSWDDAKFGDYFLSMRPFKCIEGPEKLWCRNDYPYQNSRTISGADLTDLEYDLLFVWKNASDYGINMWNGVYYKIDDRDGVLTGVMHEIDMDVLAAPPEDGLLRPISEDMLDEADPDSHWLPRLTIE